MIDQIDLPPDLAALAERDTWFSANDAELVLDWLEAQNIDLFGSETAEKLSDGNWVLRLDPMLVTVLGMKNGPASTPELRAIAIQQARDFLRAYPNLMFEPSW